MKRAATAAVALLMTGAIATLAHAETRGKAKGLTFKPAKSAPAEGYTVEGVPGGVTAYLSKTVTLTEADVKDAAYVTTGTGQDGLLIRFTDRAMKQLGDADRLATFIGGELKIVSTLEGLRESGHASITGVSSLQANDILGRLRADGASFGGPMIELIPSSPNVAAGGSVGVDVFARNMSNVRGYQITVDALGGTDGTLRRGALKLDESRSDYILNGVQTLKMLDESGGRLAALRMEGGSDSSKAGYLGTIMFNASDDAKGKFDFVIRFGGTSIVNDANGKQLPFRAGRASVTVR